ncbi:hypothetical protein OHA86_21505 [Streptomyces sp. NBC_01477]|nr:hypothetical protein [Streptomyces sp. NBC_01477]
MEFAAVQLVELPLDAERAGPDELRLQPHEFAPPDTGVALGDDGNELVVPPGQQRGALSDEQDAERVRDHLLRPTVARAPGTLAAPPAPGGGVRLAQSVVHGVTEDQVQGAAPGLQGGGRIASPSLLPFPLLDVVPVDLADLQVVEVRQQVLLNVPPIVLHGGESQVLHGEPAVGVLPEGDPRRRRVMPPPAAYLRLLLVGGLLGGTLRPEAQQLAVAVGEGAVLAGRDLVAGAPVVAALLAVSHVWLLPGWWSGVLRVTAVVAAVGR